MEFENLVKSIVEKKVNAMSFDEVMDAIFHGGKWFKVENYDYHVRKDKITEGLWDIVSQMRKEDVLQVLKNSYHAIEGSAECFADMYGTCIVVGVDMANKEIIPYAYDPADTLEEVLKNGRNKLARQLRREYMEKVETKVSEILESL